MEMQEARYERIKWYSEKLEDVVISHKFKHDTIRRIVRQAESSDIHQDWSHTKMCTAETAQEVLGQETRKRNEDWYDDVYEHWEEKNEARMKFVK